MARRTALETEALREQIIDEALRHFADHGVAATSVGDIAASVGISKQALMHHFKSKRALEEAIEGRVKASLDEMLPRFVAAFTADDTQLDEVLRGLIEQMASRYHLCRFLMRQLTFHSPATVPPAGEAISQLLLDYLRRGQRDGVLRSDFVPEHALYALGLMFLATQATAGHRSPLLKDIPEARLRIERSRELVRIARAALLPPVRSEAR